MILSLSGVVAGYGGGNVLQGVDLGVDDGSITCIIGPNGAGKSTVLRAISGLLRVKRGDIVFAGTNISHLPCSAILEMGIAQVPQQQALFPHMTIKENILMGAYVIRGDRPLVKRRYGTVQELIPLIKERSGEKAGNLSGGERRMVEIGRSLMLEPKLILLDEPSLGLDPKSMAQIREMISLANQQGRTILLVEQNVRLGLQMATHGVVLEAGKVRMEGKPNDILSDPEIATLYLGGSMEAAGRGAGPSRDAGHPPG